MAGDKTWWEEWRVSAEAMEGKMVRENLVQGTEDSVPAGVTVWIPPGLTTQRMEQKDDNPFGNLHISRIVSVWVKSRQ